MAIKLLPFPGAKKEDEEKKRRQSNVRLLPFPVKKEETPKKDSDSVVLRNARNISQKKKEEIRGGSFAETKEEVDHKIPVALGGSKADYNLQALKDKKTISQTVYDLFTGNKRDAGSYKPQNRQEGKMLVEWTAIEAYKEGKIDLDEARDIVAAYQTKIDTGAIKKEKQLSTTKKILGYMLNPGKAFLDYGESVANFVKGIGQEIGRKKTKGTPEAEKYSYTYELPTIEKLTEDLSKAEPLKFKEKEREGERWYAAKNWGPFGPSVKAAYDTTKESFGAFTDKFNELFEMKYEVVDDEGDKKLVARPKNDTALKWITGSVSTGLAAVSPLFLPFTAPIAAAKEVPFNVKNPITYPGGVTKGAAYTVDYVFGKLGELGSFITGEGVDTMVRDKIISQETADVIKPVTQELGAFIAQILGGKTIHTTVKKVKGKTVAEKVNEIIEELKLEIPEIEEAYSKTNALLREKVSERVVEGKEIDAVEGKKIVNEIKKEITEEVKTFKEKVKDLEDASTLKRVEDSSIHLVDQNKYVSIKDLPKAERIKLFDELKSIPKEDFVTGDRVHLTAKEDMSGLTKITREEAVNISPSLSRIMDRIEAVETKLSTTAKTAGVAKSIEAKAIQEGFTEKGYNELAEFDGTTFKAQAEMVDALMKKDIEKAKSIVRGEEEIPTGMRSAALLSAMEEFAKRTKDKDLMYDLANSRLAAKVSEAASELSTARMRTKDAATILLQEIKKARETVAEKTKIKRKNKESVKKEIKKETEKVNLSKEDLSWNKFLDKIVC